MSIFLHDYCRESSLNMQPRLTGGMDTLAKRAKEARERLGLRQQDVAKASGLKQSDISKIENGLILKTTGLVALAKALRCDPDWLATGEGERLSSRVWPFALLTPDQLQELPPQHLETVEKVALDLWRLSKAASSQPDSHVDTGPVPRKTGLTGTIPKPNFMKGGSEQRSQSKGTSRKTGNG
jgi:transcriptional regulator with XRE-family HTH domain